MNSVKKLHKNRLSDYTFLMLSNGYKKSPFFNLCKISFFYFQIMTLYYKSRSSHRNENRSQDSHSRQDRGRRRHHSSSYQDERNYRSRSPSHRRSRSPSHHRSRSPSHRHSRSPNHYRQNKSRSLSRYHSVSHRDRTRGENIKER